MSGPHVPDATCQPWRCHTGLLEGLRQRALLGSQPECLAGRDDHGLPAIAHGVASGHQRGPSRRAGWQAIERTPTHAAGSQRVDVGCLDVAAAIAKVGVAEVTGPGSRQCWAAGPPPSAGLVPACSRRHRLPVAQPNWSPFAAGCGDPACWRAHGPTLRLQICWLWSWRPAHHANAGSG
jgi:hypothetical protein